MQVLLDTPRAVSYRVMAYIVMAKSWLDVPRAFSLETKQPVNALAQNKILVLDGSTVTNDSSTTRGKQEDHAALITMRLGPALLGHALSQLLM